LLKGILPTVDLDTGAVVNEHNMMQIDEEEKEQKSDFYAHIDRAYEWASKQLLDLLFGEL